MKPVMSKSIDQLSSSTASENPSSELFLDEIEQTLSNKRKRPEDFEIPNIKILHYAEKSGLDPNLVQMNLQREKINGL